MSVAMSVAVPLALRVSDGPRAPSPRFVVGQDPQGRWVAVEVHGLAGGLFRTRRDAMHYAVDATDRRPNGVVVSADRIELRI